MTFACFDKVAPRSRCHGPSNVSIHRMACRYAVDVMLFTLRDFMFSRRSRSRAWQALFYGVSLGASIKGNVQAARHPMAADLAFIRALRASLNCVKLRS